ncbi:MAG TPA: xylulokinase, partial [Candidatus Dormibacteraeota bacterium]|nr:xylulokinase [Candidatus Dormibacteraeota bacterium]
MGGTLLGLDVGTTRIEAVAIDASGRVVASASAEIPVLSPRPGWTEQDPTEWWQASRRVLGRVAAEVNGDAAALGLSGQMHGAVFLDERGDVVRPALTLDDQRSAAQADEITQRIGAERLIDITGSPALTGSQASKILWLRDVEPVQYRHVQHVLLPKDYLRFKLTGELATDVSDASGTLLFNLRRRSWSPQILAALEISPDWLPHIDESSQVSGRLSSTVASDLGLPAGMPVAAGSGDRMAAALAAGVADSGLISSSIGDDGALLAHADQPIIDPSGRLQAFCHAVPGGFTLIARSSSRGAAWRWWRGILGGALSDKQLVTLGSSAPPGAQGLFFVPGSGGAFVGLRSHHSKADLTRAVMEGTILDLRHGLDVMRGLGLEPSRVRTTGGAAKSPFWRQLQADIFNLPVERPLTDQGPAYGAALLAGVAAGTFSSVHDATQHLQVHAGVNQPDAEQVKRYEAIYGRFGNLYPALHEPIA